MDLKTKWKKEAEEEKKQWNEVRSGKRDLIIIKSPYSVYPEGNHLLKFISHGHLDKYIEKGFAKKLTSEQRVKVMLLRDELNEVNKRYHSYLKSILD
jgi:hypothetical protein